MTISYRNTNYDTLDDSTLLALWDNDPFIRHLIIPHRDETSLKSVSTPEQIQSRNLKKSDPLNQSIDLMILHDGVPIGHCSACFNLPHLLTKEGKTAWFGLTIGAAAFRGLGIGRQAIQHLEQLVTRLGATQAEAGVFEFNERSLRMFQALGYQQIGRVDDFTYWNGKRWADIRFLKKF